MSVVIHVKVGINLLCIQRLSTQKFNRIVDNCKRYIEKLSNVKWVKYFIGMAQRYHMQHCIAKMPLSTLYRKSETELFIQISTNIPL